MGRSQGQSERMQKISTPLKFDFRTVQPIASCYTDYTVMAQMNEAWKCDEVW